MKLTLLLIASSILLASCVTPPDVAMCRKLTGQLIEKKDEFGIPVRTLRPNPKCMDMIGEPECGRCSWTISTRERYVGEEKKNHLYGKPWSKILEEAIVLPSESAASVKSYIIKNCKKHADCNKDIDRWRIKMDALDSVPEAVAPKNP